MRVDPKDYADKMLDPTVAYTQLHGWLSSLYPDDLERHRVALGVYLGIRLLLLDQPRALGILAHGNDAEDPEYERAHEHVLQTYREEIDQRVANTLFRAGVTRGRAEMSFTSRGTQEVIMEALRHTQGGGHRDDDK